MSKADQIPNYREFWKFYVGEHSNRMCRQLHFVASALALTFLGASVILSPYWLIGMPIASYSLAWLGHFVFEKNRPATFRYPFWSLFADFHMFTLTLIGKMKPELEKYAKNKGMPKALPSKS